MELVWNWYGTGMELEHTDAWPLGRTARRPPRHLAARPSSRPAAQPHARPPAGRPVAWPPGWPSGRSGVRPSSRLAARPPCRPAARPPGHSASRPSNRSVSRPASQPPGRLAARPPVRPSGRPAVRSSSGRLAAKPFARLLLGRRPVGLPGHLAVRPLGCPAAPPGRLSGRWPSGHRPAGPKEREWRYMVRQRVGC